MASIKLLLAALYLVGLALADNKRKPNVLNKLGLEKAGNLSTLLESDDVTGAIDALKCDKDTKKTLNVAAKMHKRLPKGDKKDFDDFFTFIANNNKTYKDEDGLQTRFGRFRDNLKRIEKQKKESNTAEFGVTKFADLTPEEFLNTYTGAKVGQKLTGDAVIPFDSLQNTRSKRQALPSSFDWRSKNAVTSVKDQGQCGSCYAFSTLGAIESVYAIRYNERYDTSEQQIVSCSNVTGGCNGGWPDLLMKWLKDGGVGMESAYPYTSGKNGQAGTCQTKPKYGFIKGFSYVTAYDEEAMRKALVNNGPLVVCHDAGSLQNYKNGILNPAKPSKGWTITHAVLIVGYGTENNVPYWIVKNSWGPNWGEQGYFRVIRNKNSMDIASRPIVPIAYDW